MQVCLESTTTVNQAEFAAWIEQQSRLESLHRYELLNGRIVMTPPAGYPHGERGSTINRVVGNFVHSRNLGKTFDSSQGFELPSGDTVGPDFSYVSWERWKAASPPQEGKFLCVVPDLVAEVLSTSTASRDRGEKKAIYEANGVREYWLVDTRAGEITVFVLRQGRFDSGRTYTAGERLGSEVLAGLEAALAEMFD